MFVDRFELYQRYKDDPMKYVYLHATKDTYEPFYVGCGRGRRACSMASRSKSWHRIVEEHGFYVYILEDGLNDEDAYALEKRSIMEYQKRFPDLMTNWSTGGPGGATGIKQTENWIRKRVQSHGYETVKEIMRNNKHAQRYFNIDWEKALEMKKSGLSNAAIARYFGCSDELIRKTLKSMR